MPPTNAPTTLNQMIDDVCRRFAPQPALSMAMSKPFSYGELHEKIIQASGLLKDFSIRKGDCVAILAENSPEWVIIYFAIIRLGAIVVPMLPDFLAPDIRHILRETKAKILFTSHRQLPKLEEFHPKTLQQIITFDESTNIDAPISRPLSQILADHPPFSLKTLSRIQKSADRVRGNTTAAIIYTSGTSGHSKAVTLNHQNLVANATAAASVAAITNHWVFLALLPLSHAYAFTINCLVPILHGSRIVFAGKLPTPTLLERICRAEKPTAACFVPLIIEKIYKKRILPRLENNPMLKMAVKMPGLKTAIYRQMGKKLLHFFGGEMQLMAIGGAALNLETEKFLARAGLPYLIGYGLTEAAPVLSGGPLGDPTIAIGSAGKPLPGVTIRIVNPDPHSSIGEIHALGDNIMKEYFLDPEATAEVIDQNGWLATGDIGYLDKKNNLIITGRTKNVIVLANGENIYPESIEDKINALSQVSESLLIANHDRLEAWVYPDYDLIDEETEGKNTTQKRQHIENVMQIIKKTVNKQLPSFAKISVVIERQEPFIKTATHKIKRYLYQTHHNPESTRSN